MIALPKTSEADLSFQVKLVLSGRLPSALPRGLKLVSQEIELPTPTVVSLSDDKEYGIPVARTLWAVHVPQDWTAKPLNNAAKNNLAEQSDGTVAVAYRSAWLQEANELMRVVEGSNYRSSQRIQASNNLKQLRSRLHGISSETQSEEGRKLAESLRDFEAKNDDLERRVVIDNRDGTTNFYVAKDQQQAARATAEQAKGNPNANADVFFDQLNSNGETFQRQVVTDNNRALLFGNSAIVANGEDINGNGILDPGEDVNGDGVLNLGDLSFSANSGIVANDGVIRFKLNVAPDGKPVSRKPGEGFGGRGAGSRQSVVGKGVTEVDRATRRKQAVDQLGDLNRAVDNEKLAQQQGQQSVNPQGKTQSGEFRSSQSKVFTDGNPAQQNAVGFGSFGFGVNASGSGPKSDVTFGSDWSEVRRRRSGRYAESQSAGNMGGGGFGGGGPVSQTPLGARPSSANDFAFSDELVEFEQAGGRRTWTQAGGLSLPIEIQREGNVLRFSRASGSPRLALTVRPNESDKLGLGFVWMAIWVSIAVWLLRLIAQWSNRFPCRQMAGGLIALGLLGMFFLPSPLSEACFVAFAIAAIALSIGVLRRRRQNAAA